MKCAGTECTTPDAVSWIYVSDFVLCGPCWLQWTKGANPEALRASEPKRKASR